MCDDIQRPQTHPEAENACRHQRDRLPRLLYTSQYARTSACRQHSATHPRPPPTSLPPPFPSHPPLPPLPLLATQPTSLILRLAQQSVSEVRRFRRGPILALGPSVVRKQQRHGAQRFRRRRRSFGLRSIRPPPLGLACGYPRRAVSRVRTGAVGGRRACWRETQRGAFMRACQCMSDVSCSLLLLALSIARTCLLAFKQWHWPLFSTQ